MKTHIVILNYNGAELFPECLPSLAEARRHAPDTTEVTLLDNGSTDDGLDYAKRNFPEFHIVKASANRFLCSYNEFLPRISEPVAILLNNDIRVAPDFVTSLVEKFAEDPKTFLVAPRVLTFDGKAVEAARSRAGVRFGLFWCNARYPGFEKEVLNPSATYSSGFGAFSREKFLELGGYDDLYLPGIMEDVDLCYRAQKAGYHLYYEPRSVVYHRGQASFKKKFGSEKIQVIAHRNNFLFMWKNFSDFRFWVLHIFFLPFRFLYALFKGNFALHRGFASALKTQWEKVR